LAIIVSVQLGLDDVKGAVRLLGPQMMHTHGPCDEVCELKPRRVGGFEHHDDIQRQRARMGIGDVAVAAEGEFEFFVFLATSAFDDHWRALL